MKDFEYKLRSVGFSKYEAKVIIALIMGHNMTPTEIASRAGIPRTSVYSVLRDFSEKGYCGEEIVGNVATYKIVTPELLKAKVEDSLKTDIKFKVRELEEFVKKIVPMMKRKVIDKSNIEIDVIRGSNMNRIEMQFKIVMAARKEVLFINKISGQIDKSIDRKILDLIKKGVKIKTIYEIDDTYRMKTGDKWETWNFDEIVEVMRSYEMNGEMIKLINRTTMPILIVDRAVSWCVVRDEPMHLSSMNDLIVRSEAFSQYMAEAFDSYWSKAMTITQFKKSLKQNRKKP